MIGNQQNTHLSDPLREFGATYVQIAKYMRN
jgi:hypothetical protein